MSTIYLLTLICAIAVISAVMLDAVICASHKPKWASSEARFLPDMSMDRRRLRLAFVGAERRNAIVESAAGRPQPLRNAA